MAGLLIYENVNMTQQLEIQHSEKSERESNLIWELFIWHALIIMWVHEYIYDNNLKSRNMASTYYQRLKPLFLIMADMERRSF